MVERFFPDCWRKQGCMESRRAETWRQEGEVAQVLCRLTILNARSRIRSRACPAVWSGPWPPAKTVTACGLHNSGADQGEQRRDKNVRA